MGNMELYVKRKSKTTNNVDLEAHRTGAGYTDVPQQKQPAKIAEGKDFTKKSVNNRKQKQTSTGMKRTSKCIRSNESVNWRKKISANNVNISGK